MYGRLAHAKMKNMQYEYLYSPGNPVATKKEKNKHTNLIK